MFVSVYLVTRSLGHLPPPHKDKVTKMNVPKILSETLATMDLMNSVVFPPLAIHCIGAQFSFSKCTYSCFIRILVFKITS